jgi:aminoglycoside phosphotransferase (APT) family kinase protein
VDRAPGQQPGAAELISSVESAGATVYHPIMESSRRELASVFALLERLHDATPGELQLQSQPLRGGLEAAGVARVVARFRDSRGRRRVFSLVVKRLNGATAREALIYQHLLSRYSDGLGPRLLGWHRIGHDRVMLFLEALRPVSAWPWAEQQTAARVLEHIVRLHTTPTDERLRDVLAVWDYEGELQRTAQRTLGALERARQRTGSTFGPALRWARRLVLGLPALRKQLLSFQPFGPAIIHGDLHPGNVVVRHRRGKRETVLLDWGRSRLGSPLEDVSSWLQSLSAWEPMARQRHDSLFRAYLSARGMDRTLRSELREAYWLAGASNALSGALVYHLTVMLDERCTGGQRASAADSTIKWVRVLRRADAFWS